MLASSLRLAVSSFVKVKIQPIEKFAKLVDLNPVSARGIHITSNILKEFRLGATKVRSRVVRESGIEGEKTVEIDHASDPDLLFPDDKTPDKLFNGVPYKELPIINIKATKNNTIMTTTDYRGKTIIIHTAGIEGFKNARRGTNIAAQQAATTLGTRTLENGIKTVRVRVQGIGPGRMASLKGLYLAGIDIVSITDDTRVSWNPPRPRKQRRI